MRSVHLAVKDNETEKSAVAFLREAAAAFPLRLTHVLTDNGSCFTPAFAKACAELGAQYRHTRPRTPQTNGMVERFNGRISDVVSQTRFRSAADLDTTLKNYLSTYNQLIPQRALKHQSPIQALQKWRAERPDLFVKRVYKLPGLDM